MEFHPATLTRAETEKMFQMIDERARRHGFCLWAVEHKETGALIGSIGFNVPDYPLPFSPCVEVGWNLAVDHWGRGYAQEGARAALPLGFESLNVAEIVAFAAAINHRSRRVMQKIGMVRDADGDFDHPHVADGHVLRHHVLYRARRNSW
jgi:RimJ/RimL family protein N-acetyltransferase